eukprot:1160919-Pelagomonas_calceolata.AAC.2
MSEFKKEQMCTLIAGVKALERGVWLEGGRGQGGLIEKKGMPSINISLPTCRQREDVTNAFTACLAHSFMKGT